MKPIDSRKSYRSTGETNKPKEGMRMQNFRLFASWQPQGRAQSSDEISPSSPLVLAEAQVPL